MEGLIFATLGELRAGADWYELAKEFFSAFATRAQCNLHVLLHYGADLLIAYASPAVRQWGYTPEDFIAMAKKEELDRLY